MRRELDNCSYADYYSNVKQKDKIKEILEKIVNRDCDAPAEKTAAWQKTIASLSLHFPQAASLILFL